MDTAKQTIAEIKAVLQGEVTPTEAFLTACRADMRAGVQRLVRAYDSVCAEKARVHALYRYEREAEARGCRLIAGVDEAGRGPLAGPVVVAAVILPSGLFLNKLNDSKKISAKVRDELYDVIKEKAIAWHCAVVDAATIDRVNIYQATMNGMYESVLGLNPQPDQVLIDAMELSQLPMPSLSLIQGDAKSASIAAASVLAKVTRDRMMHQYDKQYPQYGFAQHKGYGTAQHMEALRKYGACPIHRRSFEPVGALL